MIKALGATHVLVGETWSTGKFYIRKVTSLLAFLSYL